MRESFRVSSFHLQHPQQGQVVTRYAKSAAGMVTAGTPSNYFDLISCAYVLEDISPEFINGDVSANFGVL